MTEELAAELQAALALHDVADGGGMSATVMTADGTWSGTTGTADGLRDLHVDDQFAIASITKSVVAARRARVRRRSGGAKGARSSRTGTDEPVVSMTLANRAGRLQVSPTQAATQPQNPGSLTASATVLTCAGHRPAVVGK